MGKRGWRKRATRSTDGHFSGNMLREVNERVFIEVLLVPSSRARYRCFKSGGHNRLHAAFFLPRRSVLCPEAAWQGFCFANSKKPPRKSSFRGVAVARIKGTGSGSLARKNHLG